MPCSLVARVGCSMTKKQAKGEGTTEKQVEEREIRKLPVAL